MLLFKCLLGYIPAKTISSEHNSRGNLKRHVKVNSFKVSENNILKCNFYFSKNTRVDLLNIFKNVQYGPKKSEQRFYFESHLPTLRETMLNFWS